MINFRPFTKSCSCSLLTTVEHARRGSFYSSLLEVSVSDLLRHYLICHKISKSILYIFTIPRYCLNVLINQQKPNIIPAYILVTY